MERESTRIACAAAMGGQSSLDPRWIRKSMPGGNTHRHPLFLEFFRVDRFEDLEKPENRKLIEDLSAIDHLDKADPPIYLEYSQPNEPLGPNAPPPAGIHHPIFGIKVKEAMDDLRIEAVLVIQGEKGNDPYGSIPDFFRAKLRSK